MACAAAGPGRLHSRVMREHASSWRNERGEDVMKHLAVEPQVSVLSRSGTHDGPAEALTVSSEGGTTVRATLPAVNDLEGCNYRKLCHRSGAASRRGSQYAQPELRSP